MLGKIHFHLVNQGPALLHFPLKVTPFVLQRQMLEQFLGWQFRAALAEGELAFLTSRWLKVEIRDLGLHWFISVQDNRLVVRQHASEDVSFSGNANDFILIAARREDPDTLFFQRRLRIEGNTELGLHVKNLMDSIELESMPSILRFGLLRLAEFIKAGQKEGVDQNDRALSSC